MSTRSSIGMEISPGKIRHIYCHFDGYPEAKVTDLGHYNTDVLVSELLDLGDASTIHDTLERSSFYARDREEDIEDTKAQIFEGTDEEYIEQGQEYVYLWRDGKWFMIGYGYKGFVECLEVKLKNYAIDENWED